MRLCFLLSLTLFFGISIQDHAYASAFSHKPLQAPSFVAREVLHKNNAQALASSVDDKLVETKEFASGVTCTLQPGTRRDLIKRIAAAALTTSAAAASAASRPAGATTNLPTEATPTSSLGGNASRSFCDPTVCSMRKGSRVVHIVGTAHISSVSADLSGRLVREVTPDAVFLELDLKRIGRAFKSGQPDPGIQIGYQDESGRLRVGKVPDRPKGVSAVIFKIINAGANIIGNPIQSMYKRLESQGFLAGAEFMTAVREGLDSGAVIVLGDRDMDVTLQRIARALSKTDVNKLIETDKKLSNVMKSKVPQVEEWQKSGTFGPDELREFVETMKTEDTTRELMDVFKREVPEIHNALVGERDVYMARGIDSLSQFKTMVAVMGLGHLDGVTRKMNAMGWSRLPKNC